MALRSVFTDASHSCSHGLAIHRKKATSGRDDRITSTDAAIALRFTATGAHDPAADVSGDGSVTSLDALTILQAAADAIKL